MHFAAGPWFTVRQDNDDFQQLGTLWLSNGSHDEPASLEYRVRLDAPQPLDSETAHLLAAHREHHHPVKPSGH